MTRTPRASRACVVALALLLVAVLSAATAHAGGDAGRITLKDLEDYVGDNPLAKKAVDKLKKLDEGKLEDLDPLAPDDAPYEPETDLPGTPELPSLCKDSSECEKCFKEPYEELQRTRLRFDKLRRVNRATKTMLRDSISFGDAAASAAGGLAPLAWNSEKTRIRASEKNFNQSYDAKYAELLETLEQALKGIAACEENVFDEESWYERYGFFYQQFMAEAYRRPD